MKHSDRKTIRSLHFGLMMGGICCISVLLAPSAMADRIRNGSFPFASNRVIDHFDSLDHISSSDRYPANHRSLLVAVDLKDADFRPPTRWTTLPYYPQPKSQLQLPKISPSPLKPRCGTPPMPSTKDLPTLLPSNETKMPNIIY